MEGAGGAKPQIVQPSLLDTVRKMLSIIQLYIGNSPYGIQRKLNGQMKLLEGECGGNGGEEKQLTKKNLKQTFANCCQMTEKFIEDKGKEEDENLPKLKSEFYTICDKEPKKIATYTAGYEGHVKLNDKDYFVDVGIAELEDDQATELKEKMKEGGKEDETCRVKEAKNLISGTDVTKRGRTTSTTRGVLESNVILKDRACELRKEGCKESLFRVNFPDCRGENREQREEMVSHQYCFSPFKYNFLFHYKIVHQLSIEHIGSSPTAH